MAGEFVVLDVLKDSEARLFAPITVRKKPSGYTGFSFAIFKEFERGGETQRTSYLNERHIAAARKLLDQIEERIKQARKDEG